MRNCNKFVYLKGSGRHFIRAPEWVTIRTRCRYGDVWLEKHEIGSRFICIGHKNSGVLVANRLPDPEDQEEIIAHRVSIYPKP